MHISTILGPNLITQGFFWTGVAALLVMICLVSFTVLYQHYLYPKRLRSRYDKNYRPRVAIIIPCKGVPRDLERNLESFFGHNYPSYEILFTVESEIDPAVAVIRQVIARHSNSQLVIAGLAQQCGQKNHNLLEAIKKATNPEVYIFADSDIGPTEQWITEMVLPLSSPKVAAASGFRWQYSTKGNLAEQVHSYMNAMLYVLFTNSSALAGMGLWGGSMSMRRKDFEEMGVGPRWAETVVDDMSLSEIIQKKKRKSVLVPTAMTHTDDAIDSIRSSIRWFERQCMFLKFHFFSTWIVTPLPVLVFLLAIFYLPVALVISFLPQYGFIQLGGAGSLMMIAGFFIPTLLFPLLGPNPTMGRFLLYQPVGICAFFISLLRTTLTNSITWAAITYKVGRRGRVTKVTRPTPSGASK